MSFRAYDAADRLTSVTNGYLTTNQSVYATLTYSNNNQDATVKDAVNNLTTLVREAYDRVTQVQFPLPTVGSNASNASDYEGYTYDGNGNVLTRRLRSGDTVSFTYDALNRPTVEQFPTGKSQNVYWTYDLLGRTLSAVNTSPSGPGSVWTYDALGRVLTATSTGVVGATSRSLAYQYDAAGNRTRITWPETGANALYVNYVYDVLNRVTQIQENGATSGAGLLASYAYDTLGRRSSIARAGGSGAGTTYGYDAAGRLNSLIQSLAGSAAVTYTLGYNAANQIVTRQVSNDSYTAHPGTISNGYTTNGLSQYTTVTGATNGSYNPANSAALTYDATGALQSVTAAGTTTGFLYDGSNLVGEYDGSGNTSRRYVPGPGTDEPLVWYEGAGTSTRNWLTADQQGSIVAYADQSGNSGATYTYGPYGEPITSAGASAWGGSRYRYTGQIEIPEAQLYYYKARVYQPGLGRFFQTDPAGQDSDVNLYGYAGNDPINNGDPDGMDEQSLGAANDPAALGPAWFPNGSCGATFCSGEFVGYSQGCQVSNGCLSGQSAVNFILSNLIQLQVLGNVQISTPVSEIVNVGQKPQNISCSTRLPSGKTVGQVVRNSIANIESAAGPYDEGGFDEFRAFFATVQSGGPIDFKRNFKGSAPPTFLGDAGNFAYGAIASGIGYSQPFAEFGAGAYAAKNNKFTPRNPFGEDDSAARTLAPGYATKGCHQ